MPILTPAQKTTLLARLQQSDVAGLTDAAAAIALSTRTLVGNPDPAPEVPRPYAIAGLLGQLDAAALARVYARPGLTTFRSDVEAQSSGDVLNWLAMALAAGDITQAQHDAMAAIVNATEPDPSWPSQVARPSWAEANFGGFPFPQPDGSTVVNQVTAAMVTEARS